MRSPNAGLGWKHCLEVFLARLPAVYRFVLRTRGRVSQEKLLYLQLVKPGDTVFEVGANVGYFTLFFSDLVGKQGGVYAFEQVPESFERLRQHCLQAACENIKLYPVACADMDGETEIHLPGKDSGQASLRQQRVGAWSECPPVRSIPCRVIRLDTFCRQAEVSKIVF